MSSDAEQLLRYQQSLLSGGVETFTGTPIRALLFVLLTVGGGIFLLTNPEMGALARLVGGWIALSGAVVTTAAIHGLPDIIVEGL